MLIMGIIYKNIERRLYRMGYFNVTTKEFDDRVLKAIGYKKECMERSCYKPLYQELKKAVVETDNTLFVSYIDYFSNNFARGERNCACVNLLQEYARKDELGKIYWFCMWWIKSLSMCNKPGYYDDRNAHSVELAGKFMVSVGGCVEEQRMFKYAMQALHRTLINTMSQCVFLMLGLLCVMGFAEKEVFGALCGAVGVEDGDLFGMFDCVKSFALI